jgi:hypothetical protein
MNQIHLQEASNDRLVFRKMPILIWFSGTLIVLAALYLLYHLALGSLGVLFEGYREGFWWQYCIALTVLLFGVAFMAAGKIQTLVLDRRQGVMVRERVSLFCQKRTSEWALSQVANVRVFKRGHEGVQVMTLHFEVQVDFRGLPSQVVLQSQSKTKAVKQALRLKTFLGLPLHKADLRVVDESTSRFRRPGVSD